MKLHKARTKVGKRVCGAVGWTSLIWLIGLAGSMERETIGLLAGIVLAPVLVFGLAWGAWAAGAMDEHKKAPRPAATETRHTSKCSTKLYK